MSLIPKSGSENVKAYTTEVLYLLERISEEYFNNNSSTEKKIRQKLAFYNLKVPIKVVKLEFRIIYSIVCILVVWVS